MKKFYFYILALIALSSCHNDLNMEDMILPQTDAQKAFEKEFTAKYGTVSPDISWMTVSSDTLYADLSELPVERSYDVKVYTADPLSGADYCYLLAEYNNVRDMEALGFDYPTGLNNVFVSAVSDSVSYTVRLSVNEGSRQTVAFAGDNAEPVPAEAAPMSYIMCFEGFTDKESSLDFDYNDVVLEIEYVRGRGEATIKAVAAGCDCAAKLAYRRKGNVEKGEDEVIFEEVHSAMGYEGVYDYVQKHLVYVEMNTGINTSPKIPEATLDLHDVVDTSITAIVPKLLVYFTIHAQKEKDDTTTTTFLPAKKGSAYPQALLIADPTWKWSREGMLISTTYSLFRPWIYEPIDNPFWYGAENWRKLNAEYE